MKIRKVKKKKKIAGKAFPFIRLFYKNRGKC